MIDFYGRKSIGNKKYSQFATSWFYAARWCVTDKVMFVK